MTKNLTGVQLIEQAKKEVPTIPCDALWSMEDKGEHPTILDVREQHEWDDGHIDSAVHIPRGKLEFEVEQLIPDKNEPILICCAMGGRAALAGQTLLNMGYTDVKYLSGGYSGYCARDEISFKEENEPSDNL